MNTTNTAETGPTPDALLSAGRRLFARRGFDGTSVRDLAKAAGVNLGAVSYHFGSKRGLYEAVLGSVFGPLDRRIAAAIDEGGSAMERVERIVGQIFRHLGENPDIPHLLLQEIAAGKEPPAPVKTALRSLLGGLTGVIREGQDRGDFREGDPFLLGVSCIAQPLHLTLVRPWLPTVTGLDLDDEDARRRAEAHALAFSRAGLLKEAT